MNCSANANDLDSEYLVDCFRSMEALPKSPLLCPGARASTGGEALARGAAGVQGDGVGDFGAEAADREGRQRRGASH